MNSERTQAYSRVVKTLEDLGPAKLQVEEQDRIREAADTLLFSESLDADVRAAIVDVGHHRAGLIEVRGEDQGVGGLADAILLCGLELGGAEVLERLDDPAVGLCAFTVHFCIRSF